MQGIGLMQAFAFSQLLCLRTDGVTRRSKRLACGRPALGTKRVSDQEMWQMRLAVMNLLRNHMVLVIKDKITCMCDFSCS